MTEQLPIAGWQVKQKVYKDRGPWVDVDQVTFESAAKFPERCEIRALTPHAPAQSALDELRREVEALRADAERYRWLREADWIDCHIEESRGIIGLEPSTLDAAIDTARASTDEGVGK